MPFFLAHIPATGLRQAWVALPRPWSAGPRSSCSPEPSGASGGGGQGRCVEARSPQASVCWPPAEGDPAPPGPGPQWAGVRGEGSVVQPARSCLLPGTTERPLSPVWPHPGRLAPPAAPDGPPVLSTLGPTRHQPSWCLCGSPQRPVGSLGTDAQTGSGQNQTLSLAAALTLRPNLNVQSRAAYLAALDKRPTRGWAWSVWGLCL